MKTVLIAMVAALVGTTASAQSWESEQAEGETSAYVVGQGGIFNISCAQAEYAAPVYHFTPTQFRMTQEQFPTVIYTIDGIPYEASFTSVDPSAHQYSMDGDSMAYGSIIQVVNDAMVRGRQLTISMPDLNISATFSLSGSGAAIKRVMDNCG